jgi:hypothetical protein
MERALHSVSLFHYLTSISKQNKIKQFSLPTVDDHC